MDQVKTLPEEADRARPEARDRLSQLVHWL